MYTHKDSTPDYPQPVRAAKGAPNVLLVLLDDVGGGSLLDQPMPMVVVALRHPDGDEALAAKC